MITARRSAVTTLCWTGLSGLACSQAHPEPVYEPTPPDMSALIATYDSPTGTFDRDSMPAALDAARDIAQQIATLGIDHVLLDLVHDAAGALAEAGAENGEGGHVEAKRACDGWEQQPAAADGNGRIELTMGFSQWEIAAVAWGEAIACEYLEQDRRILLYGPLGTLAGAVRLSFGSPVTFNRVAEQPVLIDLDASVEVDDSPAPADFDFRVDQRSSALELRVAVADGDVVVVMSNDELTAVRAANGDFTLD